MGLWKRDAWRRSANEHAQQGASRGFRKGLRGFRVQPQGEEEEGRGVYFTQWWGPSVRWLVERHMVTITPVSPGSILGWREVQVWLRRLAISKVDGGPWNTEQHSFSGVVLYISKQFEDRIVIAVTGGIDVEMDTDMCKVRDTISVHRYNLRPYQITCSHYISHMEKKKLFKGYTWALSSSPNMRTRTNTNTHKHTVFMLRRWHLSKEFQYDRWTKPTFPTVTHRNTGDSEEGHVCVCTEVKFYLSFFFFIITNSRLIPREGEESSEHANMLSGLSSQWRIDEHLSHRLLKYDICSSKDHLQQDFIMCGQHTGIRGHHGIHTSTTCRT